MNNLGKRASGLKLTATVTLIGLLLAWEPSHSQSWQESTRTLVNGGSMVDEAVRGSRDSTDYFPIQVNNQWIYFFFEDVPFFYPDTVRVLQTQVINDTTYYVTSVADPTDRFTGFPKYVRKDSAGNIYGRLAGKDQLIYNVKADSGVQWKVTLGSDTVLGVPIFYEYTITMNARLVNVQTYTGIFHNCLQFLLRTQNVSDASYYVWLSPEVGIVRIDGLGNAGFWSLKRATIDGNLFSSHTFRVLGVSPGPEQQNVSDSVSVFFMLGTVSNNVNMDGNVTVVSNKKGRVNGTLTYDNKGRVFIFIPNSPIPALDTITVTLSASMTDAYEDSLDGNFDWRYEGSPTDNYTWRFFTAKVDAVRGRQHGANEFRLNQNFPNPFNPSTIIEYELPERSFVELSIYDVLGRKIKTLALGFQCPGIYEARLEGGDLPSGIYIYRLATGQDGATRKAILIK